MSGFVCIFHQNDAPIERELLQSLTGFLRYRGPDASAIWSDGPIGMGHALLRTTQESKDERQPASLDGRYWIAADARLDRREELIEELRRAKREVRSKAPDSELILHAYASWGTACVDHLIGDFSFALWDASHKQLFCARDQFGIKPCYYAQVGEILLFSNTLNCVRMHPSVSNELNDAAIGDFLLFGLNYDNATTSFRDIDRLPPAHFLTVSARGVQIRRYWAPPTDGRIRYAKPEEYIEHFLEILEAAVADRIRTDRVGILLSGGLDSSSVAAVTKEVGGKSGPGAEIRAYTHVYESLIPDRDGDFAREVGRFLGIPLKFIVMDEVQLFERWDDPKMTSPEPVDDPFRSAVLEAQRDISADCRVLFSGEGSDNLMDFQMWPYVADLRRRGEWRQLLMDVANYLWVRPFPWRGIRARMLRLLGRVPDQLLYPQWLAPEFIRHANLLERWNERAKLPKSPKMHPIHPRGHGSLSLPQWTLLFEHEDPGATGYPVEIRYPFLDLRMVDFLLAIPPFPWFFEKTLLRQAMAGRLPERARMRPKTPLQCDPVRAQIQCAGVEKLKTMPLSPEMDGYINRAAMTLPNAEMNPERIAMHLRPYCFNIWLQSARRIRYKIGTEARNG